MMHNNNEYKIILQDNLFTKELKLKFCGEGEWVEEPDLIVFEYMGYESKVKRILVIEPDTEQEAWFGGFLCGYIKISENHPYFGIDYDEMDLDAHCGLTFGEINDGHWIGFDCAHAGDYIPTMEHMRRTNPE